MASSISSRRQLFMRAVKFPILLSFLANLAPVGPITGKETAASEHWAFQPVRHVEPPAVADESDWVINPIDQFVLRRLKERGLKPSRRIGRRAFLRRLTFDLTGLPPSPEELDRFVRDESPAAADIAIDRLLASPRYGERWGRHWLDVARYADTKGYVFTSERRFPYSYTYRDYVIRSLNEDLQFDQFVVDQIAADQEESDDPQRLAAMGFLTLGRRFLNNVHDIIDDRIDVVTRGLMGLTAQCARCHDHKYDPIPTADYYSLYGVFASSQEPRELPLIAKPTQSAAYQKFSNELAEKQKGLEKYRDRTHETLQSDLRRSVGDYLHTLTGTFVRGTRRKSIAEWRTYLAKREPSHRLFGPWIQVRDASQPDRAKLFDRLRRTPEKLNPVLLRELVARKGDRLADLAGAYNTAFRIADDAWKKLRAKDSKATRLDDPALEEIRHFLFAKDSPTTIERTRVREYFDRAFRDRERGIQRAIDKFRATSPGAPPRAMVLVDRSSPHEPRIFLRGNPARIGKRVPRQFLSALGGGKFSKGSGRLELARAIVHPKNPLTARVIVNRIWRQHFGKGLVTTPSDFGTRSTPPSHPDLLDYLSSYLVSEDWSLKALHRLILRSAVYAQGHDHVGDALYEEADPENRLLWRANRRRLEFEALRDAILAVSGRIDLAMGGPSVKIFSSKSALARRSVYGFVERQNLPSVLRNFDFANPDASCPKRHETLVPQQALFLMNSPFVGTEANYSLARREVSSASKIEDRIRILYLLAYSREPEPAEVELARDFIHVDPGTRWRLFVQTLFLSSEFAYVD
ncbi:MAG: DUF1553 domain-containing protein [Planctomycetota bacterium]